MVPGEAEKTERLNTSPYAFGAIPENELLRIKGHSKIKCAVKWAKKGKSAVEIASMYGILRITPITPEVIRISFVKGVTAKCRTRTGSRRQIPRFRGVRKNRRRRFWSRRKSCASW